MSHWFGSNGAVSSWLLGIDYGSNVGGVFGSVQCRYWLRYGKVHILPHATNYYLLMIVIYPLYFTTFRSGNYCPIGSAAMVQCPAGTWGSTTSLTTAACSGQCSAGIG